MGGTVACTLRRSDGQITNLITWTNSLSYFFTLSEFLSGKEDEWCKIFLEEHVKLKKDYDENKVSGIFEYDETSWYFPWNVIAPYQYGLIVVDFKTKTLLSSQDYTKLGKLNLVSLSSRFDEIYRENFNKLLRLKKIKAVAEHNYVEGTDHFLAIPNHIVDFESFRKYFAPRKAGYAVDRYILFNGELKVRDFNFGCEKNEWQKFQKMIIDMGFHIDDESQNEWNSYLKEMDD